MPTRQVGPPSACKNSSSSTIGGRQLCIGHEQPIDIGAQRPHLLQRTEAGPGADQAARAEHADRRGEVEAVRHRAEVDPIAEPPRQLRELVGSLPVGPSGHADRQMVPVHDDVAAVQGPRRHDRFDRGRGRQPAQAAGNRVHLTTPGRCPGPGHDHQGSFLAPVGPGQGNHGVRDERGIGERGLRGQRDHLEPGPLQLADKALVLDERAAGVDAISLGSAGKRPAEGIGWRSDEQLHGCKY
jgi:hypothetical protein